MFSTKSLRFTISEHLAFNSAHPQDEYDFGLWLHDRGITYQRVLTEDEFLDLWNKFCETGYQPKAVTPSRKVIFLLIFGPLMTAVLILIGLVMFVLRSLP